MNRSLLEYLRCPAGCAAAFTLNEDDSENEAILSGSLMCGQCGRKYPIQEGIARMLPEDLTPQPPSLLEKGETEEEAVARKRSEMAARDAQVGDYDRMWHLNLFSLVEIPATLAQLSLAPHHTLLEAGCGTGRMTRDFAARCGRLIGVDFSWESLRVCAEKLRRAGVKNVDLIQADLCRLPFRAERFDRVVSCQVMEHIPTPASRAAAVEELARVMQKGGNLVLSAYQYSLWTRLFGQKEGEHAGGIYFCRFAREELRALLSRALTVEAIIGALVYHYIARCRK